MWFSLISLFLLIWFQVALSWVVGLAILVDLPGVIMKRVQMLMVRACQLDVPLENEPGVSQTSYWVAQVPE